MKRTSVLIFVLLIVGSLSTVSAQNAQTMIPVSSPAYEYLRVITAEQAEVPPMIERPASAERFMVSLEKVDYERLSPAAQRLYDDLLEELKPEPDYREGDGLAVDFGAEIALETYLQSDYAHVDWREEENDRLPFLNFPIQAWFYDSFYNRVEFPLKKVPFVYGDSPQHLGKWVNVPLTMSQFDFQYPTVAYVASGGEHWNVQAGRDALSYGSGKSGNFLISEHIPYYNFVRAKTSWDAFTFYYSAVDLENWNTGAENIGMEEDREVQRLLLSHGFMFNFIPRLRLSVRESSLLTETSPTIQYVNPFYVFHNWYVPTSNSILTVDAQVNVARGLNLYGVLAVDQLQTFFELSRYDAGDTPNAYGYILGTEVSIPSGEGYWLGNVEWVYTNPWLYIHEQSNATLIWTGHIESNVDGAFFQHLPLGYPGGPDSMNLFASLGYTEPEAYRLKGGYSMEIKGSQNVVETVWEESSKAASKTTPTGTVETSHTAWVDGSIFPRSPGWLEEVGTGLAYVQVVNEENERDGDYHDIQWTIRLSLAF